MTVDQFIAGDEQRGPRRAFGGVRDVAMNGATPAHETIAECIRYPDTRTTCTRVDGAVTIAPDPAVLFQMQSVNTGGIDALVVSRMQAGTWEKVALPQGSTLSFPKLGIGVTLDEFRLDLGVDIPE